MAPGAFSSRLSKAPIKAAVGWGAGDSASGLEATSAVEGEAALGPRLVELLTSPSQRTRHASGQGKGPQDGGLDAHGLVAGVLELLRALQEAYREPRFQAQVARLRHEASGDEVRFITSLGTAAAIVQAPVFRRFGLPPGQRGVMLMKLGVRFLAGGSAELQQLAGDLRELLGLPRQEEDVNSLIRQTESDFADLVARIERAPLDVRGPLAEALKLPYKVSALELAREVPKLRNRAKELAETHLQRGRQAIIGDGKLLGPDMQTASDQQLLERLAELFERYLQKMLARVTMPVSSFTRSPEEFKSAWAEGIVNDHHVQELWGSGKTAADANPAASEWLSLNVGITVVDGTIGEALALRALAELSELEVAGTLNTSRDPCNVGARSVWLHFETDDERSQLPPALAELCLGLAGLPLALEAKARECAVDAPRLRLHPHVMAATYRRGAEYHCHKDSYDGTDNQRMITVLLYLNNTWRPGDGGELRVYGTCHDSQGAKAADEEHFVDIDPLSGRLVMFRSRDVWHAVREPRDQRWALTLWVMAE